MALPPLPNAGGTPSLFFARCELLSWVDDRAEYRAEGNVCREKVLGSSELRVGDHNGGLGTGGIGLSGGSQRGSLGGNELGSGSQQHGRGGVRPCGNSQQGGFDRTQRLEHLAGRAGGLVGAGRPLPGGTQGQLGGQQGHLGLSQREEAGQRRGSWRRGGDNGWQHGRIAIGGGLSHAGLWPPCLPAVRQSRPGELTELMILGSPAVGH